MPWGWAYTLPQMLHEYGPLEAPRIPASRRYDRDDAVAGRSFDFSYGKVGNAGRIGLVSILAGEYGRHWFE